MSTAIRFTVITDNLEKAARAMYGGAGDVPPFVRIVTEPRDILDLPEGTLSMARLFSRGSPAGMAFDVMRSRGMLRFPDSAFLERLDAWLDRRDAARLERAGGSAQPSSAPAVPETQSRRRGAGWK